MLKVFLSHVNVKLHRTHIPWCFLKWTNNIWKHCRNGKMTEWCFFPFVCISQIFIHNQRTTNIPLTYLLHQHCSCISINNISGLTCVISKVLITVHPHIYYVFQFCYFVYIFPSRVFPWQGWHRSTICSTCQFHSLSNPRLGCYWSDRLYCSCICKI